MRQESFCFSKCRLMFLNKVINKSITTSNISNYIKSLISLMKPRVMSLVIFTCAVGLLTSPNQIPLFVSLICIFFVTIVAGAAGALNMSSEEHTS